MPLRPPFFPAARPLSCLALLAFLLPVAVGCGGAADTATGQTSTGAGGADAPGSGGVGGTGGGFGGTGGAGGAAGSPAATGGSAAGSGASTGGAHGGSQPGHGGMAGGGGAGAAGTGGSAAGTGGEGGAGGGGGQAGSSGAGGAGGGAAGAPSCPAPTDACTACFAGIDACKPLEACVADPMCSPLWDALVQCEKAGMSFSSCLGKLENGSGDLTLKGAAFCDKACAGPDPACDAKPADACFACCHAAHPDAYSGFQLIYYSCACQSPACTDSEVCSSSVPVTSACVTYLQKEIDIPTSAVCAQSRAQCVGADCSPFVACVLHCSPG